MISIIIPVHNERKNLEALLPQLDALDPDQTAEIIVALSIDTDDGSEQTACSDSTVFIRCDGKGRALQMNRAVMHASGCILVFLHADVIPPYSFFNDINTTIENGYEAGFFSYRFDKEDLLLKINAKFTTKDGIFTGGGDQCLFIRKEVFQHLGGFNEKQILMEDFEFFDRMKKHQIKYKIVTNQLTVSARKYHYNSYTRVNLSNLLLLSLFKLGVPASKLKALHTKLIRTANQPNS